MYLDKKIMSLIDKKILLFMPLIGGGGVEKNFFLIANFLATKFRRIYICSAYIKYKPKLNKNIIFINTKKNLFKNLFFIYLKSFLLLIKFLLNNKNVRILSFQANTYCILISRLMGAKIIVRSNASPVGWANNLFKRNIFNFIIKKSNKIIVNSLDFQKEMKKIFGISSKLIYNPLNLNEIKLLSKSKTRFKFFDEYKYLKILNIGRLTKQKDQITLLKSIRLIKNKIKFRLLIVGSGSERTNLNNFIKKNNLINNVKIIEYQKNPFGILKKSDLFILSSKYEGLPNVLLEAATLKKFIISSNCSTGPSEILNRGKYGLLFKVGDYKDLTKKIMKYYLMKKKIKQKMSNNLYKSLTKYNLKKNLNKYFYELKKY